MSPLIKPDTPAPTNTPHLAPTRWASGSFMSKKSQLHASEKLIVKPGSGRTASNDPEISRLTQVNRDKMLIVSHLASSKACRLDMTTLEHVRATLPYGTQATTMLCLAWKMEVSIIAESSMKVPCMILGQPCFSVFSPLTSTYLIVIQLQITSIKFHSLLSINFLFASSVIRYHLSELTFCDLCFLGFETKL
jgi:hypothetical protein